HDGRSKLSFAEAARWLVHTQAYDYSGIKPGVEGDPRVKGGKGYPIGTGWSGMTGGTVIRGTTLLETLLLNSTPEAIYIKNAD
ncbi:type I-E CRISPR-associated protein Cse1/CasA, partial [Salmonella enterica subsp. enterica serovar Typhimurium]|uniref:type I-E CRISPR-associated protein Cse1/CasA n=1 Tax=Salmonella enterica TaxID=28901 RepID=UPI0015C77B4B|nr:type I-E CRISPR-associated protein Cse1/CasA [Salmonella enterica subsp. enterica serovar Typhimurium]